MRHRLMWRQRTCRSSALRPFWRVSVEHVAPTDQGLQTDLKDTVTAPVLKELSAAMISRTHLIGVAVRERALDSARVPLGCQIGNCARHCPQRLRPHKRMSAMGGKRTLAT